MSKKLKPDAVVMVMPVRAQVAIFHDEKRMGEYYRKVLGVELDLTGATYGRAVYDTDKAGVVWWGMYLSPGANLSTIVHECSHMVDFIMDVYGIPINVANTEIRAYMLAELFGDVTEVSE